jgi:hypothetical protein
MGRKEDLDGVTIRILPNATGQPEGKLGEAELHFTGGLLAGLKLVGFAIWADGPWSPGGTPRRVTFPHRTIQFDGRRLGYALLRTIVNADAAAQWRLEVAILKAYDAAAKAHEPPASADVGAQEGSVDG